MKPGEVYYQVFSEYYELWMIMGKRVVMPTISSTYVYVHEALLLDSDIEAAQQFIGKAVGMMPDPPPDNAFLLESDRSITQTLDNKCICPTRDLCNFGCKCGGI